MDLSCWCNCYEGKTPDALWESTQWTSSKVFPKCLAYAFDHSMLNTPVLVRSQKLSNIGPGQYLDG